jgi:hypothetical protein
LQGLDERLELGAGEERQDGYPASYDVTAARLTKDVACEPLSG